MLYSYYVRFKDKTPQEARARSYKMELRHLKLYQTERSLFEQFDPTKAILTIKFQY